MISVLPFATVPRIDNPYVVVFWRVVAVDGRVIFPSVSLLSDEMALGWEEGRILFSETAASENRFRGVLYGGMQPTTSRNKTRIR